MSINPSPVARLDAVPPALDAGTASRREPGRHEAKAAAIHRLGRLRAKHFPTSLLADSAMSILLSLFVAEQQGLALSERTLALANQLSRREAAIIIENLVHAGLSVISGEESERRMVGLTPIGSARARGFVDDFPDV